MYALLTRHARNVRRSLETFFREDLRLCLIYLCASDMVGQLKKVTAISPFPTWPWLDQAGQVGDRFIIIFRAWNGMFLCV